MRYMTKEWYETMQKTDIHLQLKVSKKAETFSEDYFRDLYKRKEKEWLKLQKEVSEVEFEDIFPEELSNEMYEGLKELAEVAENPEEADAFEDEDTEDYEEFEEAKKYYLKMREYAQGIFADKVTKTEYDPEQERKNFKRMMRENIKMLQKSLPEEILQKVADIRVLALDTVSAEVKKEITRFCKENEKTVQQAIKAYQKQFEKQFKTEEPSWVEELSLHDCEVISCRKKGNDLVMTLDNSGGFTDICQIRLKNCTVMKQDAPLRGAWCLYEEIYKTDREGQYEIHFLLDKDEKLDFIVLTDDVEYQYDREEEQ